MDLGYACLSVLVKDCSPAHTVTVKRLQALDNQADREHLVLQTARRNLDNTRRLVWHNAAHGLRRYRITPQLVPLATHPLLAELDWQSRLADDFGRVGAAMRQVGLRISSHPGQYTVLNSLRADVVRAAVVDLEYHHALLSALGYGSEGRIVLHAGGGQADKPAALRRFAQACNRLPDAVRQRLCLENDDTVFGTGDVLPLCEALSIPMVLDLHHHELLPAGADLPQVLDRILATWPSTEIPKVHVSTPRDQAQPRAHADFVDATRIRPFLALLDGADIDLMVEAKRKDEAAIRLARDLGLNLAPLPGRER